MSRRLPLLLAAMPVVALPAVGIAQTAPATPAPPTVAKREHAVKAPFGAERNDPYYWLRDDKRENPEMLAYLNAENDYASSVLAKSKPLADALFGEMLGRIKQDDSSVPWRKGGYLYSTRWATGADYPSVVRQKVGGAEDMIFDQQAMAKGEKFFQIGDWEPSPNARHIVYAVDTVGRRQMVMKIRDMATGRDLADVVPNVEPNFAWSADGRTIFYIEKDPVTLRGARVKAHVLGTPASADRLVYEEKDDSFDLGVGVTADDKFICISARSTAMSESRCAPSANPASFTVFAPRSRDHLYGVDHDNDRWIVQTNRNAPNYKLMTVSDGAWTKGEAAWRQLVPHDAGVFIEDFQPFRDFIAINQRSGGNKALRILAKKGTGRMITANDPAYTMSFGMNAEYATPLLRYSYSSMVQPSTVYDVNALTGQREVLKVQPAPGYVAANYVTERAWAPARDGTKVPVTLFYRKGTRLDGTGALFQFGYGSYGNSMDPAWNNAAVSLADRGVVYAVAHIRGGQEMGRAWYEAGRLMNKKNTFTDFIDVTRYLVEKGYAAPGRVAAMGGSAGGLLMGAVANMAPQDYRVMINLVPFVDVVTTMLDTSIPLTTFEFNEWGNPAEKPAYDYMLSYSPYDNIARQAYPAMFVGTGLWDSQVQYFEPAKYVARLREMNTGTAPLVFRTNMSAGHGGKSGRFERIKESADYYAFALDQLGVK